MAKKILVIDDDPAFIETINASLTTEGYEVVSAVDGIEGLKKTEEEKPDLILLDLLMPKLGGVAFLEKIQEGKSASPVPVIIVSNLSGMDKVSRGIELGVKGYIIKSDESMATIMDNVKSVFGH